MPISKGEFLRRYAKHINDTLHFGERMAAASAEAAFENWDGVYSPEDEADEELYYWQTNQ